MNYYLRVNKIDIFGYRVLFTKPMLIVKKLTQGEIIYFIEQFTDRTSGPRSNVFMWPCLPALDMPKKFQLKIMAQHDMVKEWICTHSDINLNAVNLSKYQVK